MSSAGAELLSGATSASGAPALRVERVASLDQLAAVAGAWDRVQDACQWKHVLLDHRWFCAWWRQFGAGKAMHVLVVRRAGEVVGVVPMMISRGFEAFPAPDSRLEIADDYAHLNTPRWMRLVPIRRVTFPLNIPSHNPRGHLLLADDSPNVYEAVLGYWAERSAEWDLMCLDGLPVASPQPQRLAEAARALGMRALPHGITRTFYAITLADSVDDYLKSRSKHFRKRLKAELRSCAAAGKIEIVEHRREEIDRGLEVMFGVERRTWKAKTVDRSGVRLPLDDGIRAFFAEAARASSATDDSCVLELRLDDVPAAAMLVLGREQTDLTLVIYLDDDCKDRLTMAPVWHALIERAVERGRAGIDLHGYSAYARKWGNTSQDYRRLYIVNRRLYSRMLGRLKSTATELSRYIRRRRAATKLVETEAD